MEKVRIAAVSDIPRGEGKSFSVKGKTFAVFNVDGRFYALGNVCPHRGGSLGARLECALPAVAGGGVG